HLLQSCKLADLKTLSALLDHSLATQLSLHRHFDSCTSLLQDLLGTCSHVTDGAGYGQEFQHYSAKLCIQVLRIYAHDVKSAFSSTCRDVDEACVTSMRQSWNRILAALIALLVQ
ncbi:unnamed protein product, partial [Candidula unifasciata]